MAKKNKPKQKEPRAGKKTSIGKGKFIRWRSKGGGVNGSRPSKLYRKKPRGQGR